ncbi:MAG: NAD(P)H-dependent oxidoreductase [bacterium]
MKILIVYAHPNAESFNRALVESVSQGLQQANHQVRIKDLYAEQFDPVLQADDLACLQAGDTPEKIQREQTALQWADGLVFVYPLWWFGRPAILKGWFDLVLTNGFAFRFTEQGFEGLLPHKKALVLITAGGQKDYFVEQQAETLVHRPMTEGTLQFCGIKHVDCRVFYNIPSASLAERQAILQTAEALGKDFAC